MGQIGLLAAGLGANWIDGSGVHGSGTLPANRDLYLRVVSHVWSEGFL